MEQAVRLEFPDARFGAPRYWDEGGMWLFEVYADPAQAHELNAIAGKLEGEFYRESGILFCVVPRPLADYPPEP